MINLGSAPITNVKIGTTDINRVYLGSTLIWERATIPPPEPTDEVLLPAYSGYEASGYNSPGTPVVLRAATVSPIPEPIDLTIQGASRVGNTLYVNSSATGLEYQWLSYDANGLNETAIAGANADSYLIPVGQINRRLAVRILKDGILIKSLKTQTVEAAETWVVITPNFSDVTNALTSAGELYRQSAGDARGHTSHGFKGDGYIQYRPRIARANTGFIGARNYNGGNANWGAPSVHTYATEFANPEYGSDSFLVRENAGTFIFNTLSGHLSEYFWRAYRIGTVVTYRFSSTPDGVYQTIYTSKIASDPNVPLALDANITGTVAGQGVTAVRIAATSSSNILSVL